MYSITLHLKPCRTVVAQWTTRDFGAPVVRWGVQSGVVQHQNNGSYSTYTKLQLCGAPANAEGEPRANHVCHAVAWATDLGAMEGDWHFSFLSRCTPAGWVDPGALNFAALTELQPSTRYYYVVGDLVSL
jgi:hypothetical protein